MEKSQLGSGSVVNNPLAMQETQVWSLGWEDPLGKGMANHSSILAWRIPWTEEPVNLQSIGLQRVGHNWSDWAHTPAGEKGTEQESGDGFRRWEWSPVDLQGNGHFSYAVTGTCIYFNNMWAQNQSWASTELTDSATSWRQPGGNKSWGPS